MKLCDLSEIEIQDRVLVLARDAEQYASVTWPCGYDCGCLFCRLRIYLNELDRRQEFLKKMGSLSARLQKIAGSRYSNRGMMQRFVDRVAKKHKLTRWRNCATEEDYNVLIDAVRAEARNMKR